jgi:transcriptional regulator with XRE-family HTH domain
MPALSARFQRMIQETIGPEVRAEIGRQDISAEKLAKALGWDVSRLRRRLKGKVPWSVEEVEAIASILDVPRSQFLDPPVQHRRRAAS